MDINLISEKVIGSAYKVFGDTLEVGFLEKVYENALSVELKKTGLKVSQQKPIKVYYSNSLVGEYFIDLLVEDQVIVELKCIDTSEFHNKHQAQLINYLKASNLELGLLLNFGNSKLQIKRMRNNL